MNLFRRHEAQPKQEPETHATYTGEWAPAPAAAPTPSPDLSGYYKDRGMDWYRISSPGLAERIRRAGYVLIRAHKEASFWTDLKLEHGRPVHLSPELSIILHGVVVRTVEEWQQERRQERVNRR